MMDATHQRVLKANIHADLRHSASSISQIPTAFFISKMICNKRRYTTTESTESTETRSAASLLADL